VQVIAVLSAPTNLGLRPPKSGSVPGCAKAPEALREAGLHARLLDAGADSPDPGGLDPNELTALLTALPPLRSARRSQCSTRTWTSKPATPVCWPKS
jgi:NADPH-dependent glutamate synthase beta subunit-like oxidoreductase